MMQFITENLGTIIISAVLVAVVALIILKLRRDRKNGESSCGCGCDGCANSQNCHGK